MTIALSCHSCGAKMTAPDAAAGRKAPCPKCRTNVVVPTLNATLEDGLDIEARAATLLTENDGESRKLKGQTRERDLEMGATLPPSGKRTNNRHSNLSNDFTAADLEIPPSHNHAEGTGNSGTREATEQVPRVRRTLTERVPQESGEAETDSSDHCSLPSLPKADWYYFQGDERKGPISLRVLKQMVDSGSLAPTDLVWKQGWEEWEPAGSRPELFATARNNHRENGEGISTPRPNREHPNSEPPQPSSGTPTARGLILTLLLLAGGGIIVFVVFGTSSPSVTSTSPRPASTENTPNSSDRNPGKKLTSENYAKVNIGTFYSDVKLILGPPNTEDGDANSTHAYWKEGDVHIHVVVERPGGDIFKPLVVKNKWHTGLK